MKTHFQCLAVMAAVWFLPGPSARADYFFSIADMQFREKPPKPLVGPWVGDPVRNLDKKATFIPCLEVKVATREQTKAKDLFAKVYFYDASQQPVKTVPAPAVAYRGSRDQYALPPLFPRNKQESLFFPVPAELLGQRWSAVAVFGDKNEVAARVFPSGSVAVYEFPEKEVFLGRAGGKVERKAAMDPIVEHVVKTGNPKQPQITIFLRPPAGMTDGHQAKGVLAMCLLAGRVEQVRRQLQQIESGKEVGGLIAFAEKHQLAIIGWGSRTLWNPGASHDEQAKQVNKEMDETFDDVAKGWERGIQELSGKYGIPKKNFLLWGISGSAQWAHRLALRKPQYFLAVHVHVPSSFDQPTPEANKALWLLTTGELESGYERAKRFYHGCRELGYTMMFKAIPGLGHAGSPYADKLGLEFYEYALSYKEQLDRLEELKKDRLAKKDDLNSTPWAEAFQKPEYVGDLVNQEVFPLAQADAVPATFQVPIPTKALAEAWNCAWH